jgi:hypothetical protein
MYLFQFEVIIGKAKHIVIIAAETEEKAFDLVDIELEKHFLSVPEVKEITLYEKKKIRKGTGYVIEEK